jgi:molybdopterin-guanine dinucleotide biosynthesis protein A/molybdopterin-guanine dinucleotide biosynthesis protein
MILVGSTARNLGKTALATRLIEALRPREKVVGVKVTTIRDRGAKCPRGGDGCGACSSLTGNYEIWEERDPDGEKDTSQLLKAGAVRVFWLRAIEDALAEGLDALMTRIDREAVIVAESNSLRKVVTPSLFLMLKESDREQVKPTAREVMSFVDITVPSEGGATAYPVREILKRYYSYFTSIVLAGGISRRMGTDKALLPINGKPIIQSLIQSLIPISKDIIVSLNDGGRHEELKQALPAGVRVVYDERPGQGPLMGIYAGLKASETDVNFVIACDIPEIDPGFITEMRSYTGDHDVVVSVDHEGRTNALLAMYRRSVIPLVKKQLDEGQRKIILFYPQCRVKYVPMHDGAWYKNINTMDDYMTYHRDRIGHSS